VREALVGLAVKAVGTTSGLDRLVSDVSGQPPVGTSPGRLLYGKSG
jgi:hypothetical protein